MLYAFLIWLVMALCFVGLGIYNFLSKQKSAFGFWANVKVFDVADVKAYNRALGKLWCTFGVVFALLGLPLLYGQNSPYVLLTILGAMLEVIAAMVVYVTVIERKYRKK
ncbi:MAG: hypothetical protein K2I01_00855 [Lachnospiraceae bacterium]|nr:hypothetical protein [Lachnospiraceae bacterium]